MVSLAIVIYDRNMFILQDTVACIINIWLLMTIACDDHNEWAYKTSDVTNWSATLESSIMLLETSIMLLETSFMLLETSFMLLLDIYSISYK